MFPITSALVSPSCSVRLPEELRVICTVSAALLTHSIQAVDVLLQKTDLMFIFSGESSRHFQNSMKVNPPPQLKLFSYLLPTLLSNYQPLCFYKKYSRIDTLLTTAATSHAAQFLSYKNLQPCHAKKKNLSSTREMLLFCSEKSQGSSEKQIHKDPKLTNSTAHTTCVTWCEECHVFTKENTGCRRFPFPQAKFSWVSKTVSYLCISCVITDCF